MERADKIFCVIAAAALVAVLVNQHRPKSGGIGRERLDVSTVPGMSSDYGPAYLLSNNPISRRWDDYADPTSYRGPEFS